MSNNIAQSREKLAPSLQTLSLEKLHHIVWLDQNEQVPFKALSILQKQGDKTLKLEEFHWQQMDVHRQRLRLSIKHHQQQRQQDRKDHLAVIFNTPPTGLPSDGQVDRFEIVLIEKGPSS